MFSDNKRFIVAALIALTPLASLTADAQSKRGPSHHRGLGPHNFGGLDPGAPDSGGGQTGSLAIAAPNPADEINAWTHMYVMDMNIKLLGQQLSREKLITKRLWEEYDRQVLENTLTPEQVRQLAKIVAMRRSLDPPLCDIYSAEALNVLMEDLQPFLTSSGKCPNLPLDPDIFGQINVRSVQHRSGNIGILKNKGRLSWPRTLRAADYQESREAFTALVPQAIDQAIHDGLQPETLQDMENALGKLNGRLADNIKNMSTPRHVESKRYLGELQEALKLLEKPHAGNYFNGKFSARGKTVAELIHHMSKQGLRFAPAVSGDEAAYENLHRALVVYDVAAHYSQMAKAQVTKDQ
jgi:hypothetical protein